MKTRIYGMCRGEGKGYVDIRISGVSSDFQLTVVVTTEGGNSLPSLWLPRQGDVSESGAVRGVAVFPLLDVRAINLTCEVYNEKGSLRDKKVISLSMNYLAWKSKITYLFRKKFCEQLKQVDSVPTLGCIAVSQLLCMPDGNETVWRLKATIPQACEKKGEVTFACFDAKGTRFCCDPIFFEDQIISKTEKISGKRLLSVSFRIPSSLRCFCIEVTEISGETKKGIFGVSPDEYDELLAVAREKTKNASDERDYRQWCLRNEVSLKELHIQSATKFTYSPLISILLFPCQNSKKFLLSTLKSVFEQSYSNWELLMVGSCWENSDIENIVRNFGDPRIKQIRASENDDIDGMLMQGISCAKGDFLALLDCGDLLAPQALYEYVSASNQHPSIGALYCDEDSFVCEGDYQDPFFKSDFNRDLLYCHNYVSHFLFVHKSIFSEIGVSCWGSRDVQDYDLVLRASETGSLILHVAHMLYHRRIFDLEEKEHPKNEKSLHESSKIVLERHFERRKIAVKVEEGSMPHTYRVKYVLPRENPHVEIIIPSKDHREVLDRCITSILEKCTYDNYGITIVENNSTEEATFAYYESIKQRSDKVKVLSWPGEFNYSKIINFGVHHTQGEYVLLLNNDTQVITPDFLEEMLGYLQRPEVGVVGAKLYFHDNLVQHAGMLIGPFDTVVHVNQNLPITHGGYLNRAKRPGNFSSVTGACQMVKRTVFEEVGGYSEVFAVGYNDADFCCKAIQAGYLVVFSPYAELYHYEFVSRGREEGNEPEMERWQQERAAMMCAWPCYFKTGDPFSNSNLARDNTYFALP